MPDIFLNNRHTRRYYRLCEHGRSRITDEYTETHHIIPEAFFIERTRPGPKGWLPGNPDDPSNLTELTDREHELAHYLLTRMCDHDKRAYYKVLKGYEMRSLVNKNQENKRHFSSRRLAGVRAERARLQSEMMRGENNPNWGNTWTEEQKRAQADKVRGDKNGAKQPGVGDKIAATKNGVKRGAFSQEWLDKLTATRQGELNGMYGKTHSEETRALQRVKASLRTYSEETNDKRRVASGGRKEITDGITYKKVKIDELQSWLDQGWIVKGKPRKKRKVVA